MGEIVYAGVDAMTEDNEGIQVPGSLEDRIPSPLEMKGSVLINPAQRATACTLVHTEVLSAKPFPLPGICTRARANTGWALVFRRASPSSETFFPAETMLLLILPGPLQPSSPLNHAPLWLTGH